MLLSKRQQQVADCLVRGLSNKEAARELHIGVRTVEDHRDEVFRRMNVRNAVELTRLVYKIGEGHETSVL